MKLKQKDVIVFSPKLTHSLGNRLDASHYAIGVVLKYNKYAGHYKVQVEMPDEFGMFYALINTRDVIPEHLAVIGTL